jgi:hypothetical protein
MNNADTCHDDTERETQANLHSRKVQSTVNDLGERRVGVLSARLEIPTWNKFTTAWKLTQLL